MRLSLLLKVALLGALGAALMQFRIPLIPGQPVSYDPSEVPALIAAFALGPLSGMAVVLVKNLLHLMMNAHPLQLLGVPINTIAGWALVGTAGTAYRLKKTKSVALVSLLLGVLTMTLAMIPVNLMLLPVFQKFFVPDRPVASPDQLLTLILTVYTPFNLVKGFLTSFLTFLVYKRVSPILKETDSGKRHGSGFTVAE